MVRLCFTLALCCWILHAAVSWEDTVFGVTVRFEELSGTITVSNINNSVSISFSEIAEMGRNGLLQVGEISDIEHNFKLFRYQRFFSDGPATYVDVPLVMDQPFTDKQENITVFKKNFTTQLNNAATFNIELMIFGNTSVIQSNPAEQYQVTNNTVKFAFSIQDWRFCGYNDTKCYTKDKFEEWGEFLDVYVRYAGGRKQGEAPLSAPRRARKNVEWLRHHPTTYDYGGAEVTSSRVYRLTIPTWYQEWNPFVDPWQRRWYLYQNHTWDALPRGYPKHVSKKDHSYVSQRYEVFRFPAFFRPLYYEAFVDLHTLTYDSKSRKADASLAAVVMLSLLTFLCVWSTD